MATAPKGSHYVFDGIGGEVLVSDTPAPKGNATLVPPKSGIALGDGTGLADAQPTTSDVSPTTKSSGQKIAQTRIQTTGQIDGGFLQFPSDLTKRPDITQYTYFAPHQDYSEYNAIASKSLPLGQIYLPLPKELNPSYKTEWETKDMMEEATSTLSSLSSKLGNVAKLSNTINNSLVKAVTHAAVNPFKMVQWKGPEIRTFTFSFELVASSGQEADDLNKIIWYFKKYMHTSGAYNDLTLPQPPLWNIKFVDAGQFNSGKRQNLDVEDFSANPGNKYLFQLKDCAMTSFDVDYTAKGNAFHDGDIYKKGYHAPNGVRLTMAFTETSILTQGDFYESYPGIATN
jgi:hypothetical protein